MIEIFNMVLSNMFKEKPADCIAFHSKLFLIFVVAAKTPKNNEIGSNSLREISIFSATIGKRCCGAISPFAASSREFPILKLM